MTQTADPQTSGFLKEYSPSWSLPYKDSIKNNEEVVSDIISKVKKDKFGGPISENKIITIFNEDYTHPLAIFTMLQHEFGREWQDWEPETVNQTLEKEWGWEPNEIKQNKIGSLKALVNSPRFWKDYRVFGWVCHTWNDEVPNMKLMPSPRPAYMLHTVAAVSFLFTGIYNYEVRKYIEKLLQKFGCAAPLSLDFISKVSDNDLVKEYLNAEKNSRVEEIMDEANNSDGQALKTIGAIDYYMARLNSLKKQLKRLLGGLHIA